jgi:hypothetical protein
MRPLKQLPKGRVFLLAGIAVALILVSLGIFTVTNHTNSRQARTTVTPQQRQIAANANDHATTVALMTKVASEDMTSTATVVGSDATAAAQQTATRQAQEKVMPPTMTAIASSGSLNSPFHNLALDDPLLNNQLVYDWENCFSDGGATLGGDKGDSTLHTCLAQNTDFTNFFYQVDMKVKRGDCGGIIFRSLNDAYYYFEICRDHSYAFYTHKPGDAILTSFRVHSKESAVIQGGLGQTNRLAVLVQGRTFTFYVNGQFLTTESDSEKVTSHGSIGVAAVGSDNSASSVTFNNAAVWI